MRGGGVFVGPMVASNHLGFLGGKNRAAQGPLRWNLHRPKLPPLPGETGVDWKKMEVFPKMRGKKADMENDLKRMEIGENEF